MQKSTLTFFFALLCQLCMAQTGTITVKKPSPVKDSLPPLFGFPLFDRCVGQPKDSAVKWINACGFKLGDLKVKSYMNDCGYGVKKGVLMCYYFVNDSIDLVLTCTRKKKVYQVLIVSSVNNKLGKRLSAESVVAGYKMNPGKKWQLITEKGSRLGTFSADKGLWNFSLVERNLVKK